MSLLCETVTGRTTAELVAARERATVGDLVELRLDGVEALELPRALSGRRTPVVVTCRPVWEGGRFDGSEDERLAILRQALALGAEFVDVEWRADFADLVAQHGRRVVLSSHDFDGIPSDLEERARAMRQTGAAVIKIAVAVSRLSDTLRLRALTREGDAVVIGMGEAGLATRLLAARFGSRWTYAGHGIAPGQIPADDMVERFRFRHVRAGTALYGVVSRSAMTSLSPRLHNAAFDAARLDAVYVPLAAADFEDFLAFADAMNVQGASVTIPYKTHALRSAATADPLARRVGAANTLRRGAQGWEATNTDVAGFLAPLSQALPGPLSGLRASVLGGGGAARAIVVALADQGARVTVHARRAVQARELEPLGATTGPWPPAAGSWDLLVNTTPLGDASTRDLSPLPGGPFEGRLVYDITYGAGESRLVREARAAGCAALDGLPMLAAQAEEQFVWWTGQPPERGLMAAATQAAMVPAVSN
jgi:3-dehydroquinate dehydratase/shikimate dehydrogenase